MERILRILKCAGESRGTIHPIPQTFDNYEYLEKGVETLFTAGLDFGRSF
jgi:hypothetical protein